MALDTAYMAEILPVILGYVPRTLAMAGAAMVGALILSVLLAIVRVL